jgi:putative cell wall-binding protein
MKNRRISLAVILTLLLLLQPLQVVLGADITTDRLAGSDRYQTAVSIAQAGWTTAETAVLAAGSDANLVDALTVAPLAKLLNAPILLTENARLTAVTEAELKRLGVKTVYTSSGGGVITQPVQDAVRALGITIVPLGGADRFATAANIAAEIAKRTTVTTVVVTTAYGNADALSIASIAAKNGWPILLTGASALPASVTSFLSAHSIATTYVVGGTGVVGDSVFSALPGAIRLGGSDRYATNAAVLQQFADSWDYAKGLYIANGTNSHLVDALTASAYIAGAPLLLTDGSSAISQAAKTFLAGKTIAKVVALGGAAVTSSTILQDAVSAISGPAVVPPVTGGGGSSSNRGGSGYSDGGSNATNPTLTISQTGYYFVGGTGGAAVLPTTVAAGFFGVNSNSVKVLRADNYNTVTVANGVGQGDVGVAGITVDEVHVKAGGPNSVKLFSVNADSVYVESPDTYTTSLKLGGATTITKIDVATTASIYTPEADTSGIHIARVEVTTTKQVVLGAPVTDLVVANHADIILSQHAAIGAIEIITGADPADTTVVPELTIKLDEKYVAEYVAAHPGTDPDNVDTAVVAGLTVTADNSAPPAVNVEADVPNPNEIYLLAARQLIEAGTYEIPVADQGSPASKTTWVQTAVNAAIQAGTIDTNVRTTAATVTLANGVYTVSLTNHADSTHAPAAGSATITVTEEDASSVSESISVSQSIVDSESESVSESESESASQSIVDSVSESVSESESASQSIVDSESESVSESESASQSIVDSVSQSIVDSESESVSESESASQSIVDSVSESESASQSVVDSVSQSIVDSESESESASQSIVDSLSQSIVDSESESVSESESASQSIIDSESESVSESESASQSIIDSVSQSIVDSESASQSIVDSVSQSIVDSESTSQSIVDSVSQSIVDSESTSQSIIDSVSQSIVDSESESVSESESTSQSIVDSVSQSIVDSESTSQSIIDSSESFSESESQSIIDSESESQSIIDSSESFSESESQSIIDSSESFSESESQSLVDSESESVSESEYASESESEAQVGG